MINKEPRVNASSIRYSNSVLEIINKAEGNTFADKFEFIALDYNNNMEQRKNNIKALDKEIKDKKKQLEKLQQKLNKFDNIVDSAEELQRSILKLTKMCD